MSLKMDGKIARFFFQSVPAQIGKKGWGDGDGRGGVWVLASHAAENNLSFLLLTIRSAPCETLLA